MLALGGLCPCSAAGKRNITFAMVRHLGISLQGTNSEARNTSPPLLKLTRPFATSVRHQSLIFASCFHVVYSVIVGLAGGAIGIALSSNIEQGNDIHRILIFLQKAMAASCLGALMTVAGCSARELRFTPWLLDLRFGSDRTACAAASDGVSCFGNVGSDLGRHRCALHGPCCNNGAHSETWPRQHGPRGGS